MEKVFLANTDIEVSRVGLGTVKFGRNQRVKYPVPFQMPTDPEILNLLACAKELGINLLDTAPAYGISEERLGNLLKKSRQEWIISTKVGEEFVKGESYFDFSTDYIRRSIERSLKRLQTNYLDIVLVHSNGDDVKIIEKFAVFETLNDLRQLGLIRAFGMSTKTVEGGILAVDHSDVVMVTYHPSQKEELPVIQYAHQKQKSIFIKKAFASGHLDKLAEDSLDPVQTTMQFIFQQAGVSSIILGTINEKHLRHNVMCANRAIKSGANLSAQNE